MNRQSELSKQSSQKPLIKALARVTGFVRLLDNNWTYDENLLSNKAGSERCTFGHFNRARGRRVVYLPLDGFKLHPEGKALFARVSNLLG